MTVAQNLMLRTKKISRDESASLKPSRSSSRAAKSTSSTSDKNGASEKKGPPKPRVSVLSAVPPIKSIKQDIREKEKQDNEEVVEDVEEDSRTEGSIESYDEYDESLSERESSMRSSEVSKLRDKSFDADDDDHDLDIEMGVGDDRSPLYSQTTNEMETSPDYQPTSGYVGLDGLKFRFLGSSQNQTRRRRRRESHFSHSDTNSENSHSSNASEYSEIDFNDDSLSQPIKRKRRQNANFLNIFPATISFKIRHARAVLVNDYRYAAHLFHVHIVGDNVEELSPGRKTPIDDNFASNPTETICSLFRLSCFLFAFVGFGMMAIQGLMAFMPQNQMQSNSMMSSLFSFSSGRDTRNVNNVWEDFDPKWRHTEKLSWSELKNIIHKYDFDFLIPNNTLFPQITATSKETKDPKLKIAQQNQVNLHK